MSSYHGHILTGSDSTEQYNISRPRSKPVGGVGVGQVLEKVRNTIAIRIAVLARIEHTMSFRGLRDSGCALRLTLRR